MSVLDIASAVVDVAAAAIPRPLPGREALADCRIVSHRGEHDNRAVRENTLRAFRDARDAGVLGIECDIRWTADAVPVICHDPDLARVFGLPLRVDELSHDELHARCPEVPTLEAVIAEFGGQCHLMLELKAEAWPRQVQQAQILARLLADLEPGAQFHLLSLAPEMFERASFAPPDCMLPVAETNVARMSALALERGYAGLGGHFLLLNESLHRRHAARGQHLGTGFPASANCLRRELNRGIRWIFSNHAVRLQGFTRDMLARHAG